MDANALPVHAANGQIETEVLGALREYVREASQRYDLELDGLEGISIAANFRAFSRNFDTGFGAQDRPDPSDAAVGVTPLVLRDGHLGSHVILPKSVLAAFAKDVPSDVKDAARYTIAHELTHADEQRRCGRKFSSGLIQLHQKPNPIEVGRLAVWSEYYVCRKAASAFPALMATLEEALVRAAEEFGNDCAKARARITASNDKARVHGELISSAFRFFIVAARILGHLDGMELEFNKVCHTAPAYLAEWDLSSTFHDLHKDLRALWDSFPSWRDLDQLHAIVVVMDSKLNRL